jgi:uncharacterized radical SAM superfamily Fe-S cluster-containing enzyme
VGQVPPKVFLRRTCAEHGENSSCIASDARFYWLAKGRPENERPTLSPLSKHSWDFGAANPRCSPAAESGQACCAADGRAVGTLGRNAAGHGEGPFEKLSTCLALIEIVNSCNLACPTCYADSPIGAGGAVDAVPIEVLQRRIQGKLKFCSFQVANPHCILTFSNWLSGCTTIPASTTFS